LSSETVVVAGAILRDLQGNYLLVQERIEKAHGLWNIPAGWAEIGESPQKAAIRETKEEVGLDIELTSPTPIHTERHPEKARIYHAFLGRVTGGELSVAEDELLNASWMSFSEVEALFKNGKIRAEWVMAALKKVEEGQF
jgi:8-oxo-dGTP diphosphatase